MNLFYIQVMTELYMTLYMLWRLRSGWFNIFYDDWPLYDGCNYDVINLSY